MTTVFLQDVTLRDGMHAIRHRISTENVGKIVAALDAAGVDAIEVLYLKMTAFRQLSAALLLLLQIFGHFVVE